MHWAVEQTPKYPLSISNESAFSFACASVQFCRCFDCFWFQPHNSNHIRYHYLLLFYCLHSSPSSMRCYFIFIFLAIIAVCVIVLRSFFWCCCYFFCSFATAVKKNKLCLVPYLLWKLSIFLQFIIIIIIIGACSCCLFLLLFSSFFFCPSTVCDEIKWGEQMEKIYTKIQWTFFRIRYKMTPTHTYWEREREGDLYNTYIHLFRSLFIRITKKRRKYGIITDIIEPKK